MELVWRFLLGGAIVSAFSLLGDLLRPKRFAGLFSAAPSVAIASLSMTVVHHDSVIAAIEARSMIFGSVGFILYVWAVRRLLASGKWPSVTVSLAALTIWAVTACVSAVLLMRSGL